MRKFISVFGISVLALFVGACATVEHKKSASLARYSKIFVKPLSFNEVVLQKVAGREQEQFSNAKPALAELFRESFGQTLPRASSLRPALSESPPDDGTLVLEPRVSLIDPGIKEVLRGRGVAVCRLTDGAGRFVGIYTVSREVNRTASGSTSEVIEELLRGMGAEAALHLDQAK